MESAEAYYRPFDEPGGGAARAEVRCGPCRELVEVAIGQAAWHDQPAPRPSRRVRRRPSPTPAGPRQDERGATPDRWGRIPAAPRHRSWGCDSGRTKTPAWFQPGVPIIVKTYCHKDLLHSLRFHPNRYPYESDPIGVEQWLLPLNPLIGTRPPLGLPTGPAAAVGIAAGHRIPTPEGHWHLRSDKLFGSLNFRSWRFRSGSRDRYLCHTSARAVDVVPGRDDIVPFTGGSIRAPLEAFAAELPIEAVGPPAVAVVVVPVRSVGVIPTPVARVPVAPSAVVVSPVAPPLLPPLLPPPGLRKLDDVPSSIAVPASAAARQVLKSHTLVLRMIRLPL